MSREFEFRRIAMDDKSVIVLTNLRVFHQKDNGIFGEEKTSIRRDAITSVQIGWKRSEGILLLAIVLLGIWLLLWGGSVVMSPAPTGAEPPTVDSSGEDGLTGAQLLGNLAGLFSSRFASIVRYALLVAGVGTLVLFWFYRLSELQVVGLAATIKGNPESYEEGCRFCDFLFTLQQSEPIAAPEEEPAAKPTKKEKPKQETKPKSEEKLKQEEKPKPEGKPPDKEWRLF
jgi:hypothetical protein